MRFCHILASAALLLGGCQSAQPKRTAVPRELAPLTEAQFDEFASRIAVRVREMSPAHAGAGPSIAFPTLPADGAEPDAKLRTFASRLSDAVNDRLEGVAQVGAPDAELNSALQVVGDPQDPKRRVIAFVVSDDEGHELLRESTTYVPTPRLASAARSTGSSTPPKSESIEPRRSESSPEPPRAASIPPSPPPSEQPAFARPAAKSKAAPPPAVAERSEPAAPRAEPPARPAKVKRRSLKIDIDDRTLAAALRAPDPAWNERTVRGNSGDVIFIDSKSYEKFRLLAQRTFRANDGRLRVELDVRARDKRRDANLRVVFLDADGHALEATPVLPYRFLGGYTITAVANSSAGRAERYVVLIESD